MGSYTNNLNQRIRNRGPEIGHCTICGDHGKLTRDHIPPKGCDNIRDRELHVFQTDRSKRGTTSQGGTHFRSICGNCNNNLLGQEYDPELIKFSNAVATVARSVADTNLILPDSIPVIVKPQRVARAVVGHTLAAASIDETKHGLSDGPFPVALREYFLKPLLPMPSGLEIFYWLYPSQEQVVVKGAAKVSMYRSKGVLGDIIKFRPFGFWLVWEREQSISISLPKLVSNNDMELDEMSQLQVDIKNVPPLNFPEAPADHEAIILNSSRTYVGKPK